MERFLGKYSSCLYATLRIIAGLIFALHGSQKILAWPASNAAVPLASLMGFAGPVELIGGLLIAFGFLTSYAAFVASGQMAVAYFKAHAGGIAAPQARRAGGALLFLFLYIAAQGAGGWSFEP